jgi:hypothetical protein
VREDDIVTHFAVPLRSAWDNVHHYCATVLPFRSEEDVDAWSRRHAIPKGAVVPIAQVAELARVRYGKHADHDWENGRRPSIGCGRFHDLKSNYSSSRDGGGQKNISADGPIFSFPSTTFPSS